jgi:hypothetical protein
VAATGDGGATRIDEMSVCAGSEVARETRPRATTTVVSERGMARRLHGERER